MCAVLTSRVPLPRRKLAQLAGLVTSAGTINAALFGRAIMPISLASGQGPAVLRGPSLSERNIQCV
jgi:hypothetical protein